jgi:hemerythrin-like metal-binding protein
MNFSLESTKVSISKLKNIWNENQLELGIPIIDLQHLWLIYLIEVLNNELEKNDFTSTNLRYISAELINYISNHFAAEEELFKKFNYPDKTSHQIQHLTFIRNFKENSNFSKYISKDNILDIYKFLKSWLFNHIKYDDKDFKNYYESRLLAVNTYLKLIIENKIVPISTLPQQIKLYNRVTGNDFPISTNTKDVVSEIIKMWKSFKLGLGIPILDMQHLWLVKLTVELEFTLQKKSLHERKTTTKEILNELMKYFDVHFYTEEAIIDHLKLQNSSTHKIKHKQFAFTIAKRLNNIKNFENSMIHDIIIELKNWIVDHISSEDKQIKKHYKQNKDSVVQFVKSMILEKKFQIVPAQLNLYSVIKEVMESQLTD